MLPIRDDNPGVLTPVATAILLGINVASWVFVQGLGSPVAVYDSVCKLGLIPGALLGNVAPGTSVSLGPVICVTGDPAWYTVLSSMFMHGGWMHILGNMWFLWIFGNNVEDAMGPFRFLVFYLLCGLVAALFQVMADPGSSVPMVGASGAIGGVMGAYIVLYPRVNVHMLVILGFYVTTVGVPALFMLGYWFLVQLLGGVFSNQGGGVAFWAHVGGFAAGAALIFVFRDPKLVRLHPYHGWSQGPPRTQAWRRPY